MNLDTFFRHFRKIAKPCGFSVSQSGLIRSAGYLCPLAAVAKYSKHLMLADLFSFEEAAKEMDMDWQTADEIASAADSTKTRFIDTRKRLERAIK